MSGFDLRAYALGKSTKTLILSTGSGRGKLSCGISLRDLDLSDEALEILARRLDRAFLEIDDALKIGPPPSGSVEIETDTPRG